MTFLNSVLLAGLAAAALPILIHLFSRRRYPLINFSTLRFLKRLQRQQMRKLKLRQWLLLFLRTMAVLLVTLAFARPALLSQMGFGGLSSSRVSMTIVVDASASMQAKSQQSTVFGKAKTAVEMLIAQMNPDDRATVVIARQEAELLGPEPSGNNEALLRLLEDVQPYDGGAELTGVVATAANILTKTQDFRSELYIISDFSPAVELPEPPQNVIPYFVQIRPESSDNLSVKNIDVVSEIIEPGRPVDIEITFSNFGHTDRKDIYYSIFLNGIRIGENVVSIAAESEVQQRHQVQPDATGLQEGIVQIEERDVLPIDNRGYFCFQVVESLQLLLVGDEAYTREIRLALTANSQDRGLIDLTPAAREAWDLQSIAQYDVIIFSDPPNFSPSQVTRLIHFVENGGGLLLLPGSHTDVASINRDLLEKLSMPKWGEKVGKPGNREFFLGWQRLDLDAPILRGIFRPGSHPSTPRFYQAISLIGQTGSTEFNFHDGTPFFTETARGSGRIILCASSPHPDWSDWAERGIFAPFMHRVVLWLAGGSQEGCHSFFAGNSLELPVSSNASPQATLIYPDGQKEQRLPQILGQKVVFIEPQLKQAGFYRLDTDQRSQIAAVNIPQAESDLKGSNLGERFPSWTEAGVSICSSEELPDTVRKSRYGRELWRIALIFCLGVLVLESVIGSSGKTVSLVESNTEPTRQGKKL